MKIHDARPKERRQARKRIGRGHGSGYGRTAGRGEKGAKSRSGWSKKPGFEGGSLPLVRRLPKRGFSNHPFRTAWAEVNLDQLASFAAGSTVDEAALQEAGLIKGKYDKVVVMGRGEIEVALTIRVDRFTRSAADKIAAAGGSAELNDGATAPRVEAPIAAPVETVEAEAAAEVIEQAVEAEATADDDSEVPVEDAEADDAEASDEEGDPEASE